MATDPKALFTVCTAAAPLAIAASAVAAPTYSPDSGATFPEGTTVNFEVDLDNPLIHHVQPYWYVDGALVDNWSQSYAAFSRTQHFADDGNHTWQVNGSWSTENSLNNPFDSGVRPFTITNVDPHFVDVPFDNVVDFATSSVFPISATGADPGVLDVLSFHWDLDGDGAYDDFTGQSGAFDFATIPGVINNQIITVGILLEDGDGGSATSSFQLTMVNVPAPASAGVLALAGLRALRRRR